MSQAGEGPLKRECRGGLLWSLAGVIGLAALPFAFVGLQPHQFNVITYAMQKAPAPLHVPSLLFGAAAFTFPVALAVLAALRGQKKSIACFLHLVAPLCCLGPLGLATVRPESVPFYSPLYAVWLAMLGAGASAWLSGSRIVLTAQPNLQLARGSLFLLIALATIVHFRIEQNLYDHFMLGHADIGHFTEELKNALAGRGLRSDSFDNTRLGWHFVPLMFVLVPGYALWPSIDYLMALGPLVLHMAALPVFWFVRRATGSVVLAWLYALAWLLLPSVSRLVYSNTYGFAWLYCSVPLLALLLGASLLGRWRLCWILIALLLLSRETNAAVTLGFGAYLALFSAQRGSGAVIMIVSIAYALVCAMVIIPCFAAAGRYERLDLFGELGNSVGALAQSAFTHPGLFFGRLVRPASLHFLFLVLATLWFLPLRGWRMAMAALPTLLVHLLMENPEWLSIKFWHHAMVLPFFFFAALSIRPPKPAVRNSPIDAPASSEGLGIALALLTCSAWGHYVFGFSPVSKPYELHAASDFLQNPDPRLAFVEQLRRDIPRNKTIRATERVAAHFTDYKRLYTGHGERAADFVVLDSSDTWDPSELPKSVSKFLADPHYEIYREQPPIFVFVRREGAPAVEIQP